MRNTWNGRVDRLLATGDDKIASGDKIEQHRKENTEKGFHLTFTSSNS